MFRCVSLDEDRLDHENACWEHDEKASSVVFNVEWAVVAHPKNYSQGCPWIIKYFIGRQTMSGIP